MREHRSVIATGAFALFLAGTVAPFAAAQATAAPAAGAPATTKNWKDRAEYDLYVKITQTPDPKGQIDLLQSWQDKYPQTDYMKERQTFWVLALSKLAASDPASAQQLITKANDLLKTDPKNFTAAYFIALYGPRVGGTTPTPEMQSEVDSAAHTVLDNLPQKPATTKDEDWAKAKNQIVDIAYNSLAWEATSKKDLPGAEDVYKQSLTADPTQAGASAAYAKTLYEDKKTAPALYEYARAGTYDGPGALPEAARGQALGFFNKVYADYHGSADGAAQIIAQAKTNALPPDGFTITSATDAANKQADVLNQRIASDPGFKIWYAVKASLQDKGEGFFNSDLKEAEIPGESVPSKTFTGTVIALEPADHPTKVTLGVEDPTKVDAILLFSQPLGTEALDKVKVGEKLDFSGVAESFTKDPYTLTLKDPTIPGVKTAAPPKTGRHRK